MKEEEFDIDFSDITLIEARGCFKETQEIMLNEFSGNKKWMIISDAIVKGENILTRFVLNLYDNKNICIVDYESSEKGTYYALDLSCLSEWAQQSGWNLPLSS